MLRIGLTGGIGSGKSTVAAIFNVLGIPVYYADAAARGLMNEDKEMRKALTEHFGAIYREGKLDRERLAAMVFTDKQKLNVLNSIVHPATIRHAEKWIREQTSPYIIKEAALLFESGSNKHLDLIVGVSAPYELRVKRAMARDLITETQVMDRISKQMDEEKKISLCDFVIINDEKQMLFPQVLALHQNFLKMAARRNDSTPGADEVTR